MSAKNEDPLLNHEYDGIREFDNPTPGWWNWIFAITVVFSIGYVAYYHFGSGPSVAAEYALEVSEHQKQALELAAKSPSVTEEGLLALATDAGRMQASKVKFTTVCAACHGQKGEGLIGPNLTDGYWLNSKGDLMGIYGTVTKGVVEKGMPSWEKMFKPEELRDLVAYVGSLRNSNIPGKPPQGVGPDGSPAPGSTPLPGPAPAVGTGTTAAVPQETGATAAAVPEGTATEAAAGLAAAQ
ncbi:MAG: c-type cytochrome [Deltaproteobacteria bacterium]|nr:c-type cytochrome [Deltaproteobacteria bacterium]